MTIKYVNPLGEYSEKYGQKYWGKAHDVDMDISFNMMNPVNFEDGDGIEFEEKVIKETSKGKEYIQLRKVKRSGAGSNEPAVSVPQPKLKAGGVPAAGSQEKFLKDTSDLPFRVWTALLPYIDQQQLIKSDAYSKNLNEYVEKQSGILLKMIQAVRDGKVDLLTPKSGYEQAKEVADTLRKEDLDGLFDE